jgi:ankyrin repeat protein
VIENNADAGTTDMHGQTALHHAASCQATDREQCQCVYDRRENGETALHYAAAYAQLDVAKWLIGVDRRLVPLQSNDGRSALDLAEELGYDEISLLLSS